MPSYYEVIWDEGTLLRYQLNDSPITKIWKESVKKTILGEKSKIFENQWGAPAFDINLRKKVWARMQKCAQQWNENILSDKIGTIEIPDLDFAAELDRVSFSNLLNRLHEKFHRFEEDQLKLMLDGDSDHFGSVFENYSADPLQQLNVDIHVMESQVDSRESMEYGFFLVSQDEFKLYEITENSIYDYFNTPEKNGSLLLGYHTVGKNIFHCCLNNDVELVKAGLVRPQKTISTEVVLSFGASEDHSSDDLIAWVNDWLLENNLKDYIDMNEPMHRTPLRPILGAIVNEVSPKKINELFTFSKVMNVRLIENDSIWTLQQISNRTPEY